MAKHQATDEGWLAKYRGVSSVEFDSLYQTDFGLAVTDERTVAHFLHLLLDIAREREAVCQCVSAGTSCA